MIIARFLNGKILMVSDYNGKKIVEYYINGKQVKCKDIHQFMYLITKNGGSKNEK